MDFLEKDLEDIIYNAPDLELVKRGLFINGKKLRQLKIGNYGTADIVTISNPYYIPDFKQHFKGTISVYELKKDVIDIQTFLQALRYLKGIKRYIELKYSETKPELAMSFDYEINLIGKKIELGSSFVYLADIFNVDTDLSELHRQPIVNVNLYTYSYDYNGISFNKEDDYKLTNEGF